MLQIRPEQMAQIGKARTREFEERLVLHVCAQYPEETKSLQGPAGVANLVRRTISHGLQLGFSTERDLAALVNVTVVYGEKFEETIADPEIYEIMHDTEISPRTRLELVLDLLPD